MLKQNCSTHELLQYLAANPETEVVAHCHVGPGNQIESVHVLTQSSDWNLHDTGPGGEVIYSQASFYLMWKSVTWHVETVNGVDHAEAQKLYEEDPDEIASLMEVLNG